jgi:hypothetical protein
MGFTMKKTLLAAVAALSVGGAASASAATIVIDFEGLSAGTVLSNQYGPLVTISSIPGRNGFGDPMVFDTENFTGGDPDLASPFFNPFTNETKSFGKAAIISEDNDPNDPDDNVRGGSFVFEFDSPVTFVSFDALDINGAESIVLELYDMAGALITSISNGSNTVGDNEFLTIDANNTMGVFKAVIRLTGSGAIDNIVVDAPEVPVPAALPLMVTGLAGMGFLRRRRRQAAA